MERIAAFLRSIGVPVEQVSLAGRETFLPGLLLDRGRLLVDESLLSWPGDLLHEGGHVAVAPLEVRGRLGGGLSETAGVDMTELEHMAIPWSYAAALAIGIDPSVVFHAGGYRGRAEGLLRTFGFGVYPGAHLLEACGMTATGPRAAALRVPPFPHMLRWLRE